MPTRRLPAVILRATILRAVVVCAVALCAALLPAARASAQAQDLFITLASTTSTEQSGLFTRLIPAFTSATGIQVRVVAVGTGQALKLGERGDADVLLVHDTPSELQFVADGWGIERRQVMYNDFILVGPRADPASIGAEAGAGPDAAASLLRIARAGAPFVTRGDGSGTHKAEQRLWAAAGLDPAVASAASGRRWYADIGGGMGQALNMAAATGAYTLADRGTWLSFQNRRDLAVVLQGDPRLFNQYGVILVNPARHPAVKAALGRRFIAWLVSPGGQSAIASCRIASDGTAGESLFTPNADAPAR